MSPTRINAVPPNDSATAPMIKKYKIFSINFIISIN